MRPLTRFFAIPLAIGFLSSCDIAWRLDANELFPAEDDVLVSDICTYADRIFIGTLVSAESLWVDHPVYGHSISSDVVYTLERNILNTPETVEIRMPGGEVDGQVTVHEYWPPPHVGERHYLALDLVEEGEFAAKTFEVGTPRFVHGLWVNPNILLPSEASIQATMRGRCDDVGAIQR